ncbi:MAG: S1 RNA-binding domain-containing protein, partial [Porticoccus sp.]
ALEQALHARLHILGEMNKVLDRARDEVSDTAPRYHILKIDPDKIRDVIGKGGATIRSLTEETGATIDINDDGTIRIYSDDAEGLKNAIFRIEEITAEAEIGRIYEGTVARIVDFGAFVTIMPGTDGLLHISQIAQERVEKVTDYLKEGQQIRVKVLDVDARGRIKLSMKEVAAEEGGAPEAVEAQPAAESAPVVETPETTEE